MVKGTSHSGHVVIIGAGTMGSGLAAHFANVGWTVTLLDKDEIAQNALERIVKGGLLYLPTYASRIKPGNADSELDRVREADWVVEAIFEEIEAKRALLSEVAARVAPTTVISTNTSGLGVAEMTVHLPEDFRARFLGTHFFNPPRSMKLLELVPTDATDPAITHHFTAFAERVLGKRVVLAKDRPGFITTRIGIYGLACALSSAERYDIAPEEADWLLGPFVGRPRSGIFRLADLVGLDIIAHIMQNQQQRLPDDPYLQVFTLPKTLQKLIADGRLGEKTGAGFYRREGKAIYALDFQSLDYRPRQEPKVPVDPELSKAPLPERLKAALTLPDPYGAFVREALLLPLAYAAEITPEVAYDIVSVDQAMKWGYNWELGPFEYWDAIGAAVWQDLMGHFFTNPDLAGIEIGLELLASVPNAPQRTPHLIQALRDTGFTLFYEPTQEEGTLYFQPRDGTGEMVPLKESPEFIVLTDLKARGKEVMGTEEASAIDLGDEVLCLEFHTKANVLTPSLIRFLDEVRERAEREFAALVIGNQGSMFSAGFDLNLFSEYIRAHDWAKLEEGLRLLQGMVLRLKYARVPVVAAVHGYALGGGCEVMLHCHQVHAHVESGIGLPEALVGLIPAGGGTTLLTARATQNLAPDADPFPNLRQAFQTLSQGKRSSHAFEARTLGFLTPCDRFCFCADRLLYEAKRWALTLAEAGHRVPDPQPIRVMGEEGIARLMMEVHWAHRAGQITDHDRLIAEKIAWVMNGGNLKSTVEVAEEYLHELEREAFLSLCGTEATLARIQHMLETGKPLRN